MYIIKRDIKSMRIISGFNTESETTVKVKVLKEGTERVEEITRKVMGVNTNSYEEDFEKITKLFKEEFKKYNKEPKWEEDFDKLIGGINGENFKERLDILINYINLYQLKIKETKENNGYINFKLSSDVERLSTKELETFKNEKHRLIKSVPVEKQNILVEYYV